MRAEFYIKERDKYKSDAAVDRHWEMTPEGLEQMEIKYKMKSIEHRLSALRTMIDVANQEASNQY